MEITVEKLKELGFKRHYRDEVYRMKIGTDVINKPMYLTLVNFETSWTWYINSFEQFTGLKTIDRLLCILRAVGNDRQLITKSH